MLVFPEPYIYRQYPCEIFIFSQQTCQNTINPQSIVLCSQKFHQNLTIMKEEQNLRCPTMHFLPQARDLISQSRYKQVAASRNADDYHLLIETLIIPLTQIIRGWKRSLCVGCERQYKRTRQIFEFCNQTFQNCVGQRNAYAGPEKVSLALDLFLGTLDLFERDCLCVEIHIIA